MKKKWTTAPTRLSQDQDLIFCVRGSTTGRRVISDGVYCLGRGVCAIRSSNGCQPFVTHTVGDGLERLLSKISGSVFPNLNGPDIKGFDILLPPESIIRRYCTIAAPLADLVEHNCRQSAMLVATRDALLPKLLSGELRIPSHAN
jgi:type I restriction enzyme, S subunit